MMNRRSFLFGVASVAAAGVVPGSSIAKTFVAVQFDASGSVTETQMAEFLEDANIALEFEKYKKALRLMDWVIEIGDQIMNAPKVEKQSSVGAYTYFVSIDEANETFRYNLLQSRMDNLLGYMNSEFKTPTHSKEEFRAARDILSVPRKAEEFDVKLRQLPPEFAEAVFPIAALKFLLCHQKLPFNHRKLKEFRAFSDRYGKLILDC